MITKSLTERPFLIIFLCIAVGLLLATLGFWESYLPPRIELKQLRPLPATPIAVKGFEREHFFATEPHIQAADGQIYTAPYSWEVSTGWDVDIPDVPCSRKILRLMERSAGPLIDCQGVHTMGEWCEGPVISFAITNSADVWQITEDTRCIQFLPAAWMFFALAGFVIGVFISLFVSIVAGMRAARKAASNSTM